MVSSEVSQLLCHVTSRPYFLQIGGFTRGIGKDNPACAAMNAVLPFGKSSSPLTFLTHPVSFASCAASCLKFAQKRFVSVEVNGTRHPAVRRLLFSPQDGYSFGGHQKGATLALHCLKLLLAL